MNSQLIQQLRRFYYFAEAMAFYQAYYEPVLARVEATQKGLVESLSTDYRRDDRPLTWVPIVWHATPLKSFRQIVESGFLKPPVSFTELPLAELDRIRLRLRTRDQVAIGFPRAFLETKQITPVLYTKYNPALTEALDRHPEARAALEPYLETDDDTSTFLELRSTQEVEIVEAVWLLTTCNEGPDGRERPWIPGLDEYRDKYGRIPISLWRRDQVFGSLEGPMFLETRRDEGGAITEAVAIGERYWREACIQREIHKVRMPAGKDMKLIFECRNEAIARKWEGPLGFLDLARRYRSYLSELSPGGKLPHALFSSIALSG